MTVDAAVVPGLLLLALEVAGAGVCWIPGGAGGAAAGETRGWRWRRGW